MEYVTLNRINQYYPYLSLDKKRVKLLNSQKIARILIAAQRTSYRMSRCQNVPTKRPSLSIFCHKLRFVKIEVWSQFEFLSFVKNFVFFNLVIIWIFCVKKKILISLSQIEFLSFVTIRVFEFGHNLSFATIWVLSQFEFCQYLSFVTIWVVLQFEFLNFISIKVSSQFEFLSFITLGDFEFHHNLIFWVSSQF